MISLKKLQQQLEQKMPSVIVIPEQTVFRVSVVDNEQVSRSSMGNGDSLQIDLGCGFVIMKFIECVDNIQYISLYFSSQPLQEGVFYDS